MADSHRVNVKHLTGMPQLRVALASVSRDKRENNKHLQRVLLILGELCHLLRSLSLGG